MSYFDDIIFQRNTILAKNSNPYVKKKKIINISGKNLELLNKITKH